MYRAPLATTHTTAYAPSLDTPGSGFQVRPYQRERVRPPRVGAERLSEPWILHISRRCWWRETGIERRTIKYKQLGPSMALQRRAEASMRRYYVAEYLQIGDGVLHQQLERWMDLVCSSH